MASVAQNLNAANRRKMISEMSNGQTLFWVLVAAGIHLVLIGGTSMGYIRDRWIDPAGAAARQQAADAQKLAADQAAVASSATQPPTATTTQQPTTPTTTVNPTTDEKKLLEQRKDNPEVRKINETAKPAEIPKDPSHRGFDLDDSTLK